VVVVSRSFVATICFGHDEESIFIFLHISVGKSTRSAVVGPPDFEPDEIVGIINYAHLVSFGITHAQQRFVPNAEYIFRGRACHLSKAFRTHISEKGTNSELSCKSLADYKSERQLCQRKLAGAWPY